MRGGWCLLVSGLMVLAVATTSCGSEGGAAASVPAAPVDLTQLDVGSYPTRPRELGKVTNYDQARIIEAERLANFVPTAMEIDPRFDQAWRTSSKIFFDPKGSDLGWAIDLDRFAETAPDFITGFVSVGTTAEFNRGMDLMNVVMEFPDEAKAAEMAGALERSDFDKAAAENQPVPIPKYPAAHAHWRPTNQSIGSWYAAGRLVVYTWIYDYRKITLEQVDLPALVGLVEKSLDKVVPSIAEFRPTPPDRLMDAQLDLDGMLRRTLPRLNTEDNNNPPGAYTQRGAAHYSAAPAGNVPAYQQVGLDRFAVDSTQVFRAADAARADELRDHLAALDHKTGSVASPKNLPQARCTQYLGIDKQVIRYYCAVSFDRYAAMAWSEQLLDVQQRISAQYALLVNAQ